MNEVLLLQARKDDLYENKIANRKSATSDEQKTYGVASNNAIATRVGNNRR
jgi:gamma-glutamyltranspeptidase/glutathione hydrolase